jgi:hypothetical protein
MGISEILKNFDGRFLSRGPTAISSAVLIAWMICITILGFSNGLGVVGAISMLTTVGWGVLVVWAMCVVLEFAMIFMAKIDNYESQKRNPETTAEGDSMPIDVDGMNCNTILDIGWRTGNNKCNEFGKSVKAN